MPIPDPVIRAAYAADEQAMKELCDSIWPGTDHIPYYWTRYLENPSTLPYCIETGGRMAALAFLDLHDGAGWWHSVRVAPAFQHRGLAALLLTHAVDECRRRGVTMLRFSTYRNNEFMRRLAGRQGFRMLSAHRYVCASALHGTENAASPGITRQMDTADCDHIWRFLQTSESWISGHRTWCDAWTWRDLTLDSLRSQLGRGTVYGYLENSSIEGIALTIQDREAEYQWFFLARIEGSLQGVEALGLRLRGLVPSLKGESGEKFPLYGMVLDDPAILEALRRAGYCFDQEEDMRVFERSL